MFSLQPIRSLGRLNGWRRNLTLFACGIMATLALPPFFLVPLLIPAFSLLYIMLQDAPTPKRAFWDGWWWGWGFYMTGLYWFCIALMTEPEKFAWALPFALFGLTGVIAIYAGAACWIARKIPARGIINTLLFCMVWTVVEYARGHWFTGFPWNMVGYAFSATDASIQSASLVGAYGLTFAAVLLATLPAAALLKYSRARVVVAAAYLLLAIACGWGNMRLQEAQAVAENDRYVEGVTLRLVQPNIMQHHKWDPKRQFDGLQKQVQLSQSPGIENVTYIIWPETAVPYMVKAQTPLTHFLGESIPPGKILIAGSLRSEGDTDEDWSIFNSLMAFDHGGQIIAQYDKHHLVPFGEFLPLRWLLPAAWLTPVGAKDFSRGPGPQTITINNALSVSPLICYEAIFPDAVVDQAQRPQLLLNVTNDAWFGLSSGPHQHFEMARMRAVEQGIPLVRIANTGISAMIDSYGRLQGMLPLGTEGVLDVKLPKPLTQRTLYSLY